MNGIAELVPAWARTVVDIGVDRGCVRVELIRAGHNVTCAHSGSDARMALNGKAFDAVVLSDENPPSADALKWARSLVCHDGVVVFHAGPLPPSAVIGLRPIRASTAVERALGVVDLEVVDLRRGGRRLAVVVTPASAPLQVDPANDDPFAVHRAHVARVLPTGDPAAIKGLYRELGELLGAEFGSDPDRVPALSFPETAPVVAGAVLPGHGAVLDAGCGPNPTTSIAIASGARTVIALDIGEHTVSLAERKAASLGVQLLPVVGDLEHLPFRHGAFTAVVCDDTIEHVPDDRAAVAEFARVLQPSGRLILATPNRWSLEVLVRKGRDRVAGDFHPPERYYAATSHLREYTWHELERLLHPRFRVRRRLIVGWQGSTAGRLATRITSLPGARLLSRMVVVEAETG